MKRTNLIKNFQNKEINNLYFNFVLFVPTYWKFYNSLYVFADLVVLVGWVKPRFSVCVSLTHIETKCMFVGTAPSSKIIFELMKEIKLSRKVIDSSRQLLFKMLNLVLHTVKNTGCSLRSNLLHSSSN